MKARRWFRFTLRTMFVLLTVSALAVGWQFRIVHERRAVARLVTKAGGRLTNVGPDPYRPEDFFNPAESRISRLRRWLGDVGVGYVVIPDAMPPNEQERVRRAFAEASVITESDSQGAPDIEYP